ncbi:cytochrome P450, partial [Phycomyces blakesleeanus]
MGAQHWIMISDPYIAHEIFVKNGAKTSGRHEHSFSYEKYAKAGSGIIFSHPGKKLNSALANAMRILSHQNVDQCIEEFEFTAETTLAQMMEATEREGSVDPSIYLKLGAYNTLIKAIFGRNISSINDPVFKDLLQVTQNVLQCSSPHRDIKSLFPRLAWLECLIGNNKKKEKIVSSRDELYGRLLKEALDGDADCLAKEIYLLKEEQELEEKDLIVMLSKYIGDLIVAGETASTYMMWFFAIISQYTDIQKKMCEEIDKFISDTGRIPGFSDRDLLPYLCCVLKENGRFRSPSNFGIPHTVNADSEVSGYFIPKGTILMASMHAMHANEEVYTDPSRFLPERFNKSNKMWNTSTNGPIKERETYIFGWGRRTCPAIYFTEVEIFNMCVRTLARCSIEPEFDKEGNPMLVDLNLSNSLGLGSVPVPFKVRLVPRT